VAKRTNNDLQNTTQKTIDQQEPHYKPGVNSRRVSSSCPTCCTRCATYATWSV